MKRKKTPEKVWSKLFKPSCFGEAFEWGKCQAQVDMGERKQCPLVDECFKAMGKKKSHD